MVKVIYNGTAFAAASGITAGVLGTYNDILSAYNAADKHCRQWCDSHKGKTLRPIVGPVGHIGSWTDPSKVSVHAYGGYSDCLYMNYEFKQAK